MKTCERLRPEPNVRHFVVLGPDDTTLFYSWGHSNVIPWEEVLQKAREMAEAGGLQQDITDISLHRGHVMIDATPDIYKWGRVRSRYSLDVKQLVRELLRRGLISENTPVKLGNWANQLGARIGTARQVVARPDMPNRLVLYHGTTDSHYWYIREQGLHAMPRPRRIWKDTGGKRGHPLYREEAVYLTATRDTAAYYAKKAVRVLRAHRYQGVKPVVLRVQLHEHDFPSLRPDDDYLFRQQAAGKAPTPDDWFESLQWFGQVAFVGTIPPEQLTVVKIGT